MSRAGECAGFAGARRDLSVDRGNECVVADHHEPAFAGSKRYDRAVLLDRARSVQEAVARLEVDAEHLRNAVLERRFKAAFKAAGCWRCRHAMTGYRRLPE